MSYSNTLIISVVLLVGKLMRPDGEQSMPISSLMVVFMLQHATANVLLSHAVHWEGRGRGGGVLGADGETNSGCLK